MVADDKTDYIPSSSQDVTKQVQYYEEVTGFGEIENDPQFLNVGLNASFNKNNTVDQELVRVVGSADPFTNIMFGYEGVVDITYRMFDTVMSRFGVLPPTGAGTPKNGLAFLESRLVNNTEMFKLHRGCLTDRWSIKIARMIEVTQSFYCAVPDPDWKTEAALKTLLSIVGTPKYATALSTTTHKPWTNLAAGTTKPLLLKNGAFTADGTYFDNESLDVSVNRNIMKQKPSGYFNTKYAKTGNRDITGTWVTYLRGNELSDLVKNFDGCDIEYKLFHADPSTDVYMTITNCHFTGDSDKVDAGSNTFDVQTLPFIASSIDLTSYTAGA